MTTMTLARRVSARMGTLGELATYLITSGRWWLLPMVGIFLLGAGLMAVVQLVEYAAPFVYTVF